MGDTLPLAFAIPTDAASAPLVLGLALQKIIVLIVFCQVESRSQARLATADPLVKGRFVRGLMRSSEAACSSSQSMLFNFLFGIIFERLEGRI